MIITPNDIADTLDALIAQEFPGETVYRELVPNSFERPCNLIVQDHCEGDVQYGCAIVELRPTFTLTTFVKVNEYQHSHLADLHMRQMRLVGLLLAGYIEVGGRAPKVEKLLLGGGYDYDTVTVTFSYTLDRNDFMDIPKLPPMGELHLNEEVKTYG